MSLLTIVQNAAAEIKIIKPTSVVNNTDPDVESLFRQINKVGDRLMKLYPWQILTKEHTFTSVATEEQTGILPADFDRFRMETFWNRTDQYFISGPISSTEWQGLKATSYSTEEYRKFAIRGDSILVIPTMGAGKTLAFEYVSKNWCQSALSVGQTVFAADTDTSIINEELLTRGLIWEHLNAEGLPNAAEANNFVEYYKILVKNDRPNSKVMTAGDIFGGVNSSRRFTGAPTVSGGGALF